MSGTGDWPLAWGTPVGTARVAVSPEDFQVDERLGFAPTGDGPHLLVRIRKRGLTTQQAVQQLAGHWQVERRAMGYAGRKDRQAVTTQWLSVPWPVNAPLAPLGRVVDQDGQALDVIDVQRHRRKLPVGALTGNRFTLTLRDVDAAPRDIAARLVTIARHGVPNYFGGQRFGRHGQNLDRALKWLAGGERPRSRNDRSMLISAARSAMFNAVLARRIDAGDWSQPRPGDLLVLDGRGSLFAAEAAETAFNRRRAAGLRIHPTGPLPGAANRRQPQSAALIERESAVLQDWAAVIQALADQRVTADRRALRLSVGALAGWRMAPGTWRLRFELTRGAYATMMIRELVEAVND